MFVDVKCVRMDDTFFKKNIYKALTQPQKWRHHLTSSITYITIIAVNFCPSTTVIANGG